MKTTEYFRYRRMRLDRAPIDPRWIELALTAPLTESIQSDGRIRRWVYIAERDKYLRVVLLEDRETVHNAFFDRNFRP